MRNLSKMRAIIFMLTVVLIQGCAMTGGNSTSSNPLLDRTGQTFELWVDGKATYPIEALKIVDSQGTQDSVANWRALSDGKLCLKVNPKHPGLGNFERVGVVLKEIRSDRPYTRWRNFRINPPQTMSEYGSPRYTPGQELCPVDLFLTERLRFKKLPAGNYILEVRLHGDKNWDRQAVFLAVQ